jgi:post-segregation antitoxin (ccd killing protein)
MTTWTSLRRQPWLRLGVNLGAVLRSANTYPVHMARVNITIPDELLAKARTAGLDLSRLAAAALAEELDRRAKLTELDAYLARLDAELGPVSSEERLEAAEWAHGVLPAPGTDSA